MKKFLVIFIIFLASFSLALASTTNGTISTTNKKVWASKIGWINFNPDNANDVLITDTAITGKVWSQSSGWINLNPAGQGITNDSEGNLSGFAWGPNIGFISFSGVIINSSGKFTGTATGTIAGTVNFDCGTCNVNTDWRPASSRSGTSGGSSGSYLPNINLNTNTENPIIPSAIPQTQTLTSSTSNEEGKIISSKTSTLINGVSKVEEAKIQTQNEKTLKSKIKTSINKITSFPISNNLVFNFILVLFFLISLLLLRILL
jgi:hypothetical protein